MSDVQDLLTRAAGMPEVDQSTIDGDVARGRRALRRRRAASAGGSVAVLAAIGVLTAGGLDRPDLDAPLVASEDQAGEVSPPQTGPQDTPAPDVGGTASSEPKARDDVDEVALDSVVLVAFDGEQPSGYDVELIPDGWEIQAADPYYMVIAPIGAADQDPRSFVGKLLVMLRSESDQGTPHGSPVPFGDEVAYLNLDNPEPILTYLDAGGTWVQVQAPPGLGWGEAEIVDFAAGVTVTPHAEETQG